MAELTDILNRLVVNSEKQEERFAAQQKQIADQQSQIADLLQNIKEPPPVTVEFKQPPPENNVIRAEKIQKIS